MAKGGQRIGAGQSVGAAGALIPWVLTLRYQGLKSPIDFSDGDAVEGDQSGTEDARNVGTGLHHAQLLAVPEQLQREAAVVTIGFDVGVAVTDQCGDLVQTDQDGAESGTMRFDEDGEPVDDEGEPVAPHAIELRGTTIHAAVADSGHQVRLAVYTTIRHDPDKPPDYSNLASMTQIEVWLSKDQAEALADALRACASVPAETRSTEGGYGKGEGGA